mgnify:CR=1 FL=1
MIYWSHFKCMTTEPGVLPKDYDELDFSKMAPIYSKTIYQIGDEMKRRAIEDEKNGMTAEVLEKEMD